MKSAGTRKAQEEKACNHVMYVLSGCIYTGLFTKVFFCCFLCHSILRILLLSKTEVPEQELLVCQKRQETFWQSAWIDA